MLASLGMESVDELFADIPPAGQVIEARRPVLSFFTRAEDAATCIERLKGIAQDLDRYFAAG
jgi:glycine cleavage system pyridoxal-binding protein P